MAEMKKISKNRLLVEIGLTVPDDETPNQVSAGLRDPPGKNA